LPTAPFRVRTRVDIDINISIGSPVLTRVGFRLDFAVKAVRNGIDRTRGMKWPDGAKPDMIVLTSLC
jgi:hypothetical protein